MPVINITVTRAENDMIDINTAIPESLSIKDVILALQKTYNEFSEQCQQRFGVDSHLELIEFINENPEAGEFTIKQLYKS